MTLPNFGIPDQQTAMNGMASASEAMQEAMRHIALPLATQLSNALQVAQAPEKYLEKFANRALGRAAAQTQRLVNEATNLLPVGTPVPIGRLAVETGVVPGIGPIVPPAHITVGHGCVDEHCVYMPPECPPIPGTSFFVIHWRVSDCDHWRTICTTLDQVTGLAQQMDAEVYGPYLTYQDAYEVECSHAN